MNRRNRKAVPPDRRKELKNDGFSNVKQRNRDRVGMSDGLGFVFNAGVMGISGDQRRKFFRNGDHGRGRGSQDRRDLPTAP